MVILIDYHIHKYSVTYYPNLDHVKVVLGILILSYTNLSCSLL